MKTIKVIKTVAGLLALAISIDSNADMDAWQSMQLLDPPQSQLMAEANGRVMIYDGMPMKLVDRAMDEQFERIDSMMFTRIRHETPEGEEVEDDGC